MGDKQPQAPKQAKTKQEPQKPKPKSNFSTIPSTTIDSATSEKSEQNNHNHNHNHNKPDKVREGERQNRRPRYPDKVPNHLDVNKNLPKEAKFTMVEEHDPEDDKFDFDNLLTEQVRRELTHDNLKPLSGTEFDPEQFLKSVPPNKNVSFLDREIDAKKLYQYMVSYMKVYYDISTEMDAFSKIRQTMDDQLWDTLCYIIPLLCRQVIHEALRHEPIIVTSHPDLLIFGDIHGNFNDIYYINRHYISNSKYDHYRFVFLGDYVDRGPKSVEVVVFLFTCKLMDPHRFILLRGNHEVQKVNKKYGFQALVEYIFKDNYVKSLDITKLIYQSFNCAFNFLPLAAIVKQDGHKSIWCCHGGVPSSYLKATNKDKPWTIDELNALSSHLKPNSLVPSAHASKKVLALNEILWNDPLPRRVRSKPKLQNKLFYRNMRRGGHCHWFTEPAVIAFCEVNNLRLIIRGHQYKYSKEHGYGIDCDGRLLTVFSSSNYCGIENNVTGYVVVNGEMIVTPSVLRKNTESEQYRKFNFFEIKVNPKTKQITDVLL